MSQVEETPSPQVEDTHQKARRWLRVLLLASLGCLLLVVGSELPQPRFQPEAPSIKSGQPGPEDQFIIAGQRVGFVRLGLSIGEVETKLGRGLAKPTQSAVLYRFDKAGLTCAVQHGQIASILVNHPDFRTPQGTSVNSNADQVVRELGDQYEYETPQERPDAPPPAKPTRYTLHYWREGIHVTLKDDVVESLLITPSTGP